MKIKYDEQTQNNINAMNKLRDDILNSGLSEEAKYKMLEYCEEIMKNVFRYAQTTYIFEKHDNIDEKIKKGSLR